MTGAEFREMASNKRMQMQFTDIQGGIEKECWGGGSILYISILSWLIKYSRGTIRSELGIQV